MSRVHFSPPRPRRFSVVAGSKPSHLSSHQHGNGIGNGAPSVTLDSMHIQSAMGAQRNTKMERTEMAPHHYLPEYIQTKREELLEAQRALEHKQKEQEDRLLSEFNQHRAKESDEIDEKVSQEWEFRLKTLLKQFEDQADGRHLKMEDKRQLTVKLELEKQNLRSKLDEQRETYQKQATLRLRQKEQRATAEMVEKFGHEMLGLITDKHKEIKRELRDNIRGGERAPSEEDSASSSGGTEAALLDTVTLGVTGGARPWRQAPPPHPPLSSKSDLFIDPSVFAEVDAHVIRVAEHEPESFTELVAWLLEPCLTDLEKVRAIFRWITVKDLNVMDFSGLNLDSTVQPGDDTPLGILRGIKLGTETYHTLFMRLCSYAGLHCREIRGHSKSVGYEPGMRFEREVFQNTWNAVLVDDDWRLVQCNWGARHLVLNKDKHGATTSSKESNSPKTTATPAGEDNIRYQYDEHYFLTDPHEFVQEFWPFDPAWQLLPAPRSLQDFENLPFVRSVFFHYALAFKHPYSSVLHTDGSGGVQVSLVASDLPRTSPTTEHMDLDENSANSSEQAMSRLVFHYQLRFADKDVAEHNGARLDRFVYQTTHTNEVNYKIFVPSVGDYFVEIFAARLPLSQSGHHSASAKRKPLLQPFKLKCACKFRIRCDKISQKMHPLPACSAGEWGPAKALRHFGLIPVSSLGQTGAFEVSGDLCQVTLRMPYSLQFLVRLRCNAIPDADLEPCVDHVIDRDIVTVRASFPISGQFGLDIYARRDYSENFAHACKYLINASVPISATTSPPLLNSGSGGSSARHASSSSSAKTGSLSPPHHKSGPTAPPVLSALPSVTVEKPGPTQYAKVCEVKAVSQKDFKLLMKRACSVSPGGTAPQGRPLDLEFACVSKVPKGPGFATIFKASVALTHGVGGVPVPGGGGVDRGQYVRVASVAPEKNSTVLRFEPLEEGAFSLAIFAAPPPSPNTPAANNSSRKFFNVFNYRIVVGGEKNKPKK